MIIDLSRASAMYLLNNLQMLKLARLSVSKVSSDEWKFLVGEMKKNGDVVGE